MFKISVCFLALGLAQNLGSLSDCSDLFTTFLASFRFLMVSFRSWSETSFDRQTVARALSSFTLFVFLRVLRLNVNFAVSITESSSLKVTFFGLLDPSSMALYAIFAYPSV